MDLNALAIHNLINENICEDSPEYSLRSSESIFLKIDPFLCALRPVVHLFEPGEPDGMATGAYGLRTQIRRALLQQMDKLFVCWWCPANTTAVLERSLLDLCDGLDDTGSISSWTLPDIAPLLMMYVEQQRSWGKCCVVILEDPTVLTLHKFFRQICPKWGLHVVVIAPQHPPRSSEFDGTPSSLACSDHFQMNSLATLQLFVTDVNVCPLPPLRPPEEMPDSTLHQILRRRAEAYFVPFILSQWKIERATTSREEYDESYLVKAFARCGFRIALLQVLTYAMLQLEQDTYEILQILEQKIRCYTEEEVGRWGAATAAVLDILCSVLGPADAVWVRALCALPSVFPEFLIPSERLRGLFVKLGLVHRLAPTPCGGIVSVTPSWIRELPRSVFSSAVWTEIYSVVIERIERLQSIFPDEARLLYDIHQALVKQEDVKRALEDSANAMPACLDGITIDDDSMMGKPHAKTWHRWGEIVIEHVIESVRSMGLFIPDLSLHMSPMHRDLQLHNGVPPLPADESVWVPLLATLYRAYAKWFSDHGDPLNAANATERALCIYINLFDGAVARAEKRFEAHEVARTDTSLRMADSLAVASGSAAQMLRMRSVRSSRALGTFLSRKETRIASMSSQSLQTPSQPQRHSNVNADAVNQLRNDAVYAHRFSLMLLAIEASYRNAAGYYIEANLAGIAEPLLNRSISIVEMLNNHRRDTPARAMNFLFRAKMFKALSDMEHRRGQLLQQSETLESDTSDMKLKAVVKSDVDERHFLREAAVAIAECVRIIGANGTPALTGELLAECYALQAQQLAAEYNDCGASALAEKAAGALAMDLREKPIMWTKVLSPSEEVAWASKNFRKFLLAIRDRDYYMANSMLDRSPLVAFFVEVSLSEEIPEDTITLCASGSDLLEMILSESFPEPVKVEHLDLFTTFSMLDIARHHGKDWRRKPVAYHIPTHEILLHRDTSDETLSQESMALIVRLVETLGVSPRCCSPHDMKTLLHIASETLQTDVIEFLLRHPDISINFTPPYVLQAERQGLSSYPVVKRVPNELLSPFERSSHSNSVMLMLLLEGRETQETFAKHDVFVVEQLSADPDGEELLRLLFGVPNAPFKADLARLVVDRRLSSEVREQLARICSDDQVIALLFTAEDGYVMLELAAHVATLPDSNAVSDALLRLFVRLAQSCQWDLCTQLMKRFPNVVNFDTVPYDEGRSYKLAVAS